VRRSVGLLGIVAIAASAAAGGAFVAARAAATRTVVTAAKRQQIRQTCALSPFRHDANVVVSGVAAARFCRTQAHVLRLRGDEWTYRAGRELLAPDHGAAALGTVCSLRRGPSTLRVYDSGGHAIGSDLCRWYVSGGWKSA
jgi:hypothetical protein